MPNYFQQAQPYNVGQGVDVTGTLKNLMDYKQQGRRLSLLESQDRRAQTEFEEARTPEALASQRSKDLLKMSTDQLEHQKNVLSFASQWLPEVHWDPANEDWQGFRGELLKMGANPELIPESFESPQEMESWKQRAQTRGMSLLEQTNQALKQKELDDYQTPQEKAALEVDTAGKKKAAQLAAEKKAGVEGEGRAIKTWQTPDGEIVHLPNNVAPPKGSVPYKDEALSIMFTPEGGVHFQQGSMSGLGGALTARDALAQQSQRDRLGVVIDTIDSVIDNIEQSPTRAGVWGGIRGAAQKIAGVAEDIAPETLARTMKTTVENIPGLSKEQREGMSGYFDSAIPENEIYSNTIALELAKLRVLAGGGSIRAIESAFKAARKDVALTGAFSSQEALTRLRTVRREFESERQNLEQRLSGRGTGVEDGTYRNDAGEEIVILNGKRVR